MQLIYEDKTNQSIRRVVFPEGFSRSVNPKHFSNIEESLKFLNEIIIPYVNDERPKLKLPKNQKALMVMDVLRGQINDAVVTQYQYNNILMVNH